MKILVTGSHGLVGSAVVNHLTATGHYVVRLVRRDPHRERGDIVWDPASGKTERSKLEGLDAVVHLAGENIFGLWTKKKKARIHRSRVQATEFLAEILAGLTHKPRVIVAASAIGYYGDRADRWLDESSHAGDGFLAQLCQEWEHALDIAAHAGIRVVSTRFGLIMSTAGGALQKMLPAFKLGLGGKLGHGRQYMSWISLEDVVRVIQFALENETLEGPVNTVAPDPVTNKEFTKTLGRILQRPTFFAVPTLALKLLPYDMGREMFLASARVEPAKLKKAGFVFQDNDLEKTLQRLLNPS